MPNSWSIEPASWVRASTMSVTTDWSASRARRSASRPESSMVRPPEPVTAKSTPWSALPASHSTLPSFWRTVAGSDGEPTEWIGDHKPRTSTPASSTPVAIASRPSTPAAARRGANPDRFSAAPTPARARPVAAAGQPGPARPELEQVGEARGGRRGAGAMERRASEDLAGEGELEDQRAGQPDGEQQRAAARQAAAVDRRARQS